MGNFTKSVCRFPISLGYTAHKYDKTEGIWHCVCVCVCVSPFVLWNIPITVCPSDNMGHSICIIFFK